MAGDDNETTWLSAAAARARLLQKYRRPSEAEDALVESAASGAVRTKCRESVIETESGPEERYPDGGEVTPSFWRSFQEPLGSPYADWVGGNFTAKYRAKAGHWQWTRLCGVEFNQAEIQARFDLGVGVAVRATPNPPAPPRSIAGAPPASAPEVETPRRNPPPAPASTARGTARLDPEPAPATHPDDFENKPTEEAFARWLRPAQALAMRGELSADAAVEVFLIRMRGGVLPTFAGLAKWFSDGKHETEKLAPFPWQWWARVEVENAHDLFWQAPVADLVVESDRKGSPIYFFDIRFDPDAVEAMFGLPPRDAAQTPQSLGAEARRRRVPPPYAAGHRQVPEKPRKATRDELRQWFPMYELSSQDFRFDSVFAAATKHFNPRPVSRQPVRDIIGEFERTRTRGKPAV